ncbi:MAG: hypothetical protein ACHQPI_05655 [Thermoanaerobaculia bacterium]
MNAGSPLPPALGGIALFLLAGSGVLRFFPALRERPFFRRMAWAWLLGVAAVGIALFGASHLLHAPLDGRSAWAVFLGLALLRFVPQRTAANFESPRSRAALATRIVLLVAAALATLIVAGLLSNSVSEAVRDHDGPMTWDATARWIRAEKSVNAAVLREPHWYVSHPQYPLLLPLMQVATQEAFAASDDTRVIRPLYAVFLAAFLLVLYDVASRRAGRMAAALATLSAALVPFLSSNPKYGGAGTTYSDVPLGCFWGAGFLLLLEPGLRPSTGVAAGMLLGATVLTKSEGAPFALIALGIGVAVRLHRAHRRALPKARALVPLALAGLVTAASFLLLVSWNREIPNRFDEDYVTKLRTAPVVAMTLARLPEFPKAMWNSMTEEWAWAGFWWCVPIILLTGARALSRRAAWPLLLAPAAALGVFMIAYGITGWPGTELVRVTFSRFLLQMSIPLFVLIAMSLDVSIREMRP